MEKELTELRTRINALGERLGHGENAYAQPEPGDWRERELRSELHDLKVSSGRLTTDDLMMTQVMYGPSRFSIRNEQRPAQFAGPPPVGLKQRFAQQDEAVRRPDDSGKVPGIWRRLFGRK